MNQKFTIHQLAERVGNRLSIDSAVVEEVIKTKCQELERSLVAKGSSEFNGVGVFSTDEDGNIQFNPDGEASAQINAPFSIFEPEDLNPQVDFADFDNATEITDSEPTNEKGILTDNSAPKIEETELGEDASTTEPKAVEADSCPLPETPPAVPIVDLTVSNEPSQRITPPPFRVPDRVTPDEPQYVSAPSVSKDQSLTMFIVGLIVGLAVGAVATFVFMSLFSHPDAPSDADEVEIVEEFVV